MVEAHDVFISYARPDRERARALADALTAQGWSVWWDLNLVVGDKFQGVIEENLIAARCVVVLWSKDSIKSDFVMDEAKEAKDANKLLPLTIDGSRPPFGFRQHQTPDVSSWIEGADHPEIARLIERIDTWVERGRTLGNQDELLPRNPPTAHAAKWAVESGRDEFGKWADADIAGVRMRFRWIEPGSFTMGSPADELERYEDEEQQDVSIAEGFWMADTTVTQELWTAVMGTNPSRFQGARRPVEQVSWRGAKDFLIKLNQLAPGLDLRLPLEAEWEYACRAGTTTPFSFGENSTTDQVNYNGDYPYRGASNSENRQHTVDVKSLPPNPWGLYEMHGNVWEWCEDAYGGGPERVVRGGSWSTTPSSAGPRLGTRTICRYGAATWGSGWPEVRASSSQGGSRRCAARDERSPQADRVHLSRGRTLLRSANATRTSRGLRRSPSRGSDGVRGGADGFSPNASSCFV